jgi:hypothetical protein
MNYKKIFFDLLMELNSEIINDLGNSFDIYNMRNSYKKNINFIYHLKCDIKLYKKNWNKDIFNNFINTLEDGISNNTIDNDELSDKYIGIINDCKIKTSNIFFT